MWSLGTCSSPAEREVPVTALRCSSPVRCAPDFVTDIHDEPPVLTGVVFIGSFFCKEKQD